MKLNKKGVTIVEIIISIALISMVLIFLTVLLIKVNDLNKNSDVNSTYLISKALVVKNVEEDIKDIDSIEVSKCEPKDVVNKIISSDEIVASVGDEETPFGCVKISYEVNSKTKDNYIIIYYSTSQKKYDEDENGELKTIDGGYVIFYYNGSPAIRRSLPDFEINNEGFSNDDIEFDKAVLTDGESSDIPTFHKITIPIVGSDGKDYSIIISYYGKVVETE